MPQNWVLTDSYPLFMNLLSEFVEKELAKVPNINPYLYRQIRREITYQPVTIETVDRAVFDWFDKTVDANAPYSAGDRRKVPVIFSSGERYAIRRKGIRDQNGVLVLPLISVRRTGMDPDPTMQALGTQTGKITVAKRISPKTNNIQNNLQQVSLQGMPIYGPGPGAVYEVTSIPFPDRNVFSYELVVQAQFVTQMNSITEKLFQELDIRKSFVAPFENVRKRSLNGKNFEDREPFKGGYVCGLFDSTVSDFGNFEEFTDQERIVRYSTTIRVPATLQLESEGEAPSVQVEKTAYAVGFKEDVISAEDFELLYGSEDPRR